MAGGGGVMFELFERRNAGRIRVTGWSVTKQFITLGEEPAKSYGLAAGDLVVMLFDVLTPVTCHIEQL